MQWDLIIRNAKVFDGHGGAGRVGDVAIKNGKIAALGGRLPTEKARLSMKRRAMAAPGLLDIHTHEDLEAELDPGLPEVVRHGTTRCSRWELQYWFGVWQPASIHSGSGPRPDR